MGVDLLLLLYINTVSLFARKDQPPGGRIVERSWWYWQFFAQSFSAFARRAACFAG